METVIHNYFDNIFATSNPSISDLNYFLDTVDQNISDSMNCVLDAKFTAEDIWTVVKHMHPSKAPDLDGMPAIFYQKFWDVVGQDVVGACLACLNDGMNVDFLNKTVIVMVPKIKIATRMVDFRSISLCNVL
ncbi:hypothetical protein ACOSQ4_006348 [Xanthoceras sorbifolium]